MSDRNFVDYVKICCRSGAGGAGSSHFFRDRLQPRGGPDGGDGGNGGSIIVRANPQLWTLLHLKYRKHVIAKPGGVGGASGKTGASGDDVILEVPLGTIAKDAETGEVHFEVTSPDEEYLLVKGGKGGLGNSHFKSSTNQTPLYAQPGMPGGEEWKILELKLLADVGLVGFPNAGKSTLLASISAARPAIADYPFTTLVPNLGIVGHRGDQSFVMADIPGIIENAHEGKGLGHRFLRHIERNSLLLFIVPADADSIIDQYNILLHELEMYNPELMYKPRLLGISKSDLIDEELRRMITPELPKEIEHAFFSGVSGKGLTELKDKIWDILNRDEF